MKGGTAMKATPVNEKTARAIINTLAENNRTVADSEEILKYVSDTLKTTAIIQKRETPLFED